ncbi:tumor necrosis factor receptor superfamily member 16-like [Mercenaria mercenaria]|uniref:tumor necrosis factor receptor superfamily member 16-like n=1 Tax=Mercenaria mercenaria TaxID=6596 RepID=UPI00234EB12A|nr:tumor necrosis factor receptor superfamily member 16-like [Mercenaria mercenaria]XP_045203605.2 tumor necrosis factor receptor superfamily member 16-like [Mercenaria mercenaria]
MECLRISNLKGLHILQLYDILYVIGMHVTVCAAVSPNSPQKNVPLRCTPYKFVSIDDNGDSKCRRCSVCPKGFQVQTECSTYNDTVCEQCPSGWYNDVSGSNCKPCSECKPGEYIRRDCSVTRNTSCRHCPRDMISASTNASWCVPCKLCRRNEKMLSKCNGSQDTTCGECKKGFFRESSTGNCLLCSHCPPTALQNSVVPECREKYGIHHPDICWPSDIQFRFPDFNKISQSSDGVTLGDEQIKKEIPQETLPLSFILAVSCTLLLCLVVLLSAFICLRMLPTRYSTLNQPVHLAAGISSIPMSRVYVNSESLNESNDSIKIDHSDIECTYFPADGGTCGNENLVDIIPLKSLESTKHRDDKGYFGDMRPRTGSVPETAMTFITASSSFKETSKGDKQICTNWELPQFLGNKIYGTI